MCAWMKAEKSKRLSNHALSIQMTIALEILAMDDRSCDIKKFSNLGWDDVNDVQWKTFNAGVTRRMITVSFSDSKSCLANPAYV